MHQVKTSMLLSSILGMCFVALAFTAPVQASARSIELIAVEPALDQDITPPDNEKDVEENFYTFWFKGQIGTEYEASFTVSEEPAFTFVSGGNMNISNAVHYNPDTSTFTVTYTAEKLERIDAQSGLTLEEGQTLTIVAMSFPVAEGEDGPGIESTGSWISTNFQEWSLLTPSIESNFMGARVRGDVGDTGQFKLYISQRSVDAMAENDNAGAEEYTAEDFALYKDGVIKPKKEIKDVSGGGTLLNFYATIPEESNEFEGSFQTTAAGFVSQHTQGSSLEITVGPRPALTLRSDKSKVKALRYVTLTGKLRSGAAGKTVYLHRRTITAPYKLIATTTTDEEGRYSFRIKVRKLSAFQVKTKKYTSEELPITIK